ncbi:MAG: methionine--tRNA ligase [Spirochaetaceae bacterium]|jgi:methionyl-tRNA synthetase|nr:methionine--tRNA ligase [Spirochaetaceae bacterium]
MNRRLITSALPYVNNEPHLGNLIQVLSADCFARFCRLRGYETLYICGTDEYGTATETRAAEEGVSERELCDRYWRLHDEIYRWFTIKFDEFGRTSTPIQTEVTQDIFKKNDANGMITEKTGEQLFCPKCDRFLADRYVRGVCPHCGYEKARGDQCERCGKLLDPTDLKEPACSSCGSTPELRETKHLYIDLPKNREKLETWIKTASAEGRWARNAIQMAQSWIRDGLHERAITRDLKWGIPVPKPGYEKKVFYVWFDAPIGYISITGNWAEKRGLDWRKTVDDWWKNPEDVALFQFIGKDNIPFHTVIFPSSLLGTGEKWTMLHHMSSSEYLNYESGKFSKSEGRGVFGTDVMNSGIPSDVWRFYIYYTRPEKSDALFTWKDFAEKVNAELIGNLGNLVNRTLSFVTRYYNGKAPAAGGNSAFWEKVRKLEGEITDLLEWAELRDGYHKIFELAAFANKYFQENEPWKKRTEAPAEAEAVIGDLTALLADIAVLIQPFTPVAAEKIAGFLGLTLEKGKPGTAIDWSSLGKGTPIDAAVHIKSEVLFAKLEDDFINGLRTQYAGSQKERENERKEKAEAKPEDKFAASIDLRVAKIVKIERHPKADKLYVETLDIAGEERVIVSGLVPFYKEEELLNKHVIVAYNLKAAKLRGIESRGMLLAASVKNEDGSETVEVLEAADAETGTRIKLQGVNDGDDSKPVAADIDIDTFFSVPIAVTDGIVNVNGKAFTVNGKPVTTEKVKNGEAH